AASIMYGAILEFTTDCGGVFESLLGANATMAVMTATQTITPRARPNPAPSSRSSHDSFTAFIIAPTIKLTIHPKTITATTISRNPHKLDASRDPTHGRTTWPAMR